MCPHIIQSRSVEDLKERYYSVCNRLIKARGGEEGDMVAFDAPHEVKRKMQVLPIFSSNICQFAIIAEQEPCT